ncbi:GNAT family N-acetyltransferase [Actinocrinis puniceicyclus]|uniref:GNAT family N-acetyltransferase n=1 Tax=Actinocrinis puniceicyclus TaxID=977794 RepID=A0A8J7WQM8_9ACTN|nr:GNAT family N-acetyltransferase [Actinocrinis puniceicyclus]MBS2964319.1 GNAT family N-acetyltransferase [Actinocrinis puniceicyclus]
METNQQPQWLPRDVSPPEQFAVDGMLVRRWTADDEQAGYEAITASYEPLHAWMDWISEPRTRQEHREWIERQLASWPSGFSYNYGVFDAAAGTLLAVIGVHDRVGPGGLEIGYWCHIDHTGKGVITRAARALTDILLALPGVDRVEIHCDEANERSAAVPRRLGYRLDRIEDDTIAAPLETGRAMVWIKERERA